MINYTNFVEKISSICGGIDYYTSLFSVEITIVECFSYIEVFPYFIHFVNVDEEIVKNIVEEIKCTNYIVEKPYQHFVIHSRLTAGRFKILMTDLFMCVYDENHNAIMQFSKVDNKYRVFNIIDQSAADEFFDMMN